MLALPHPAAINELLLLPDAFFATGDF